MRLQFGDNISETMFPGPLMNRTNPRVWLTSTHVPSPGHVRLTKGAEEQSAVHPNPHLTIISVLRRELHEGILT